MIINFGRYALFKMHPSVDTEYIPMSVNSLDIFSPFHGVDFEVIRVLYKTQMTSKYTDIPISVYCFDPAYTLTLF